MSKVVSFKDLHTPVYNHDFVLSDGARLSNVKMHLSEIDPVTKRECSLYHYSNCMFGGISREYPNVLLRSLSGDIDMYIIPIKEKTMSLNRSTVYEEEDFDTRVLSTTFPINIKTKCKTPVFFFVYNTHNYFHFLYDALPYLYYYLWLRKRHVDVKLLMARPDKEKGHYKFVRESLALLGIVIERDVVYLNDYDLYTSVYIGTSLTHDFDSNAPPRKEIHEVYNEMRDGAISEMHDNYYETPEKIYISRRSWVHGDTSNIGTNYTQRRKFMEEDELVEYLIQQGFKEVFCECLTMAEKIMYFNNASVVVGAIGGGMSNLLFAGKETNALVICSPEFLKINSRMLYSFEPSNYKLYKHTLTYTQYPGQIPLYTRVRVVGGEVKYFGKLGEIIDYNNETKEYTVNIAPSGAVGWNADQKYETIYRSHQKLEKLDEGLNSPWTVNIETLKNNVQIVCNGKFVIVRHRINTMKELKEIPSHHGVEIDLRDYSRDLVLTHDPFIRTVEWLDHFDEYLKEYNHSMLILNVKSERIEPRILESLERYDVQDYFFLDSSFPMIYQLLTKYHNCNVALRFSEFEGLDTIRNVVKLRNEQPNIHGQMWVWVDCFTKFPLTKEIELELHSLGLNICLVSPELQGHSHDKNTLVTQTIKDNNIIFDAVCTKGYNVESWK